MHVHIISTIDLFYKKMLTSAFKTLDKKFKVETLS